MVVAGCCLDLIKESRGLAENCQPLRVAGNFPQALNREEYTNTVYSMPMESLEREDANTDCHRVQFQPVAGIVF